MDLPNKGLNSTPENPPKCTILKSKTQKNFPWGGGHPGALFAREAIAHKNPKKILQWRSNVNYMHFSDRARAAPT
jgi:hypothetical protein